MTSYEKARWDVIEAEHERQRAVLDARLQTPPKKDPPETLKITTITNPHLPEDQSWIPEGLTIGLWESGWLLSEGATKEYVRARFDPQIVDGPANIEDLQQVIKNHNRCHHLLENFHHGTALALTLQGGGAMSAD